LTEIYEKIIVKYNKKENNLKKNLQNKCLKTEFVVIILVKLSVEKATSRLAKKKYTLLQYHSLNNNNNNIIYKTSKQTRTGEATKLHARLGTCLVLQTGIIARELVLLRVTVVDDVPDGAGKDFGDLLVGRVDPSDQQVFDGRLVVVVVDVQQPAGVVVDHVRHSEQQVRVTV